MKHGEPIVQERILDATPSEIFDAWSDPESLSFWMRPAPNMKPATVEVDFRVGGRFRIVMHGEQDFVHTGEYQEIVPDKRIVLTWVSEWFPAHEQRTRVEVNIEAVGEDQARLRLVHDDLPDSDSYNGHVDGWAAILDKLTERLAA